MSFRMGTSSIWANALLFSLTMALVLRVIPRYPDYHRAYSHTFSADCLINGSGCTSKKINMLPQDSNLSLFIDKIVHCRPSEKGRGLVEIHTFEVLRHAVFRVRITGPEVHIVPIRHHAGKLHYGEYRVGRPGEYYIEVMMLYISFNETQIQRSTFHNISNTWVSAAPFLNASEITFDLLPKPLCKSSSMWVMEPDLVEYMQRTRTWSQDSWPPGHPLIYQALPGATNLTGLRFETNCQMIDPWIIYNPLYGDCVKRSKICMWGDSQMRYLYNTIVSATFHNTDASTNHKEVLDGQGHVAYFPKMYDNFDQDMDILIESGKCRVIIANFGHWPASWQQGYPWPFNKYKIYVEADIEYLKQLVERYDWLNIFWMTTNPHGYVSNMLANTEWRTDPVLDRYHDIAVQLTTAHRVRILDTYRIAKPVNDLTYDGKHYQGIVGLTLASYVLSQICNV